MSGNQGKEVNIFAREVTMYLKSVVSGRKKAVAVLGDQNENAET